MLAYLVDAALGAGREAEARELFAPIRRIPADRRSVVLDAAIAYADALLYDHPPGHRPNDATAFERFPFMRGRYLLARGAKLRRQRRASVARAPLREAEAIFTALGASPWTQRARQELRASGERLATHVSPRLEVLTPQELEIAMLAADGLTNREIGQQLFLSHRTVGSHLYRIFPKLDVTSRRELAKIVDSSRGLSSP
jgi:DNA-binding CsgD family transcriptional regulator